MSVVEVSWTTPPLDEVAVVQGGYAFKSKDFESEGTPVLRISNISGLSNGLDDSCARIHPSKLEGLERFKLNKGDIVVALSGATTGKFGVFNLDEPVFLNQRVGRINTKNPDALDQRYLFYYFGLLQKRILDEAYGAAQPNISPKEIAAFEIPLPPLPEQRRIVARIEELFSRLDAGVAALRHAKAQLQRYRQSVLAAAVTGELTQAWREQHPDTEPAGELLERILERRRELWKGKYKEPEAPDPPNDLSLPGSWQWTNLSQLKSFSIYGPRFSSDDYAEDGVLVLRTSDISEGGKVNSETAPKLPLSETDFEKYKCEKGDLLITRTGSLGTLAVYNDDSQAIPGAYLIQYRLALPDPLCWFLFHFFKSPLGQSRLAGGGQGVGRPNLNAPTIESIPIPLPPTAEQHQIVAEVEARTTAIDHVEAELDRQIASSNRLRQSTLASAFRGKLVVTQTEPLTQ